MLASVMQSKGSNTRKSVLALFSHF